ncbi:hypothetical protein Vretimale_16519 [Volvox reticuliferus]|uniref:Cystatin domain-containing protein n=1 Tax=Volvox reticuliferus TaxID=1737510 RepID=A0A8J4CH42_9CHLO|nr:hypothetical protein Vretifemale_8711 [Volvox reticuliferus]GIM13365.1 hypothetical protein Vretimale_16519 [Volvox reticuliferus]
MKNYFFVLCSFILLSGVCIKATSDHSSALGGIVDVDAENPGIKAAADYVVSAANTNNCNGLCSSLKREGKLQLVKILSAKTQVVAGVMYNLELLLEDENGHQVIFNTSVWSRPWLAGRNDGTDHANQITKFHYEYVNP